MSRRIDTAGASPRFTGLETAIMAALAHDQRAVLPGLAGQFARARPGRRRNTAFGAYTEVLFDQPVTGASLGVSGRFGAVHAMITGLPESIAFQVELYQGRVIALHADGYGQDTRAIDFATAHPTEIFTLDEAGRSVPVTPEQSRPETLRPAPTMRESLLHSAQRRLQTFAPPPDPPPLVNAGPLQRVQETERPVNAFSVAARAFDRNPGRPPIDPPVAENRQSLLFGLWVALGAIAILATLLFRLPFPFAAAAAFFVGRAIQNPKILDTIAALLKKAQEHQALKATKP